MANDVDMGAEILFFFSAFLFCPWIYVCFFFFFFFLLFFSFLLFATLHAWPLEYLVFPA